MVYSTLFDQPSTLGVALNGLSARAEVINNNIANVDTPGFKKSSVQFEDSLQKALDKARRTGELDLHAVRPMITKIHENFSYRIDGNNVDIELEMVDLYQTQMTFDTLVMGINNYYRRINSVLSMRL